MIWQNYKLRQMVAAVPHPAPSAVTVRDRMMALPVMNLDNKSVALEFRGTRTMVAVVSPNCGSCEALLGQLPREPSTRVLSIGPLAATKAMAERYDIARQTFILTPSSPKELDRALRAYPQLFVVDRGQVVRTCATVAECR